MGSTSLLEGDKADNPPDELKCILERLARGTPDPPRDECGILLTPPWRETVGSS
jgi:hypothetical protein